MPRLPWLADAARATGYPVTEVEGWQTRGSTTFNPRGLLWHHTAGPTSGDMPSLNILVNGRSGLAGPLSQYGLGRSGRIYVVAAGRANHAGTGGWNGLTGNGSVVGIEAEHTGRASDPWPAAQLDSYRKLSAQILTRLGSPVDFMCGHKEWAPTRKIDPISLNMASERTRVRLLMEDDMDIETVRALAREPIIQALQRQTVAWYRRLQAATGIPGGNADYWGTDYTGSPRPSIDEWHAQAVTLHSAALSINASGGLNDAQVRQIVVETGAQVFVEKGKPVVIRGT